jgi:prepilin-type N-terminal cleavage/methylation domain-containing protein
MNTYIKERREEGFTLIELLIAIVVVGILTAVVIVGIGGLPNTGSKGACQASADAAKAASVVHHANAGAWPADFNMLAAGANPELEVAAGVTPDQATLAAGTGTTALNGNGWTLTLNPPDATHTSTYFTGC